MRIFVMAVLNSSYKFSWNWCGSCVPAKFSQVKLMFDKCEAAGLDHMCLGCGILVESESCDWALSVEELDSVIKRSSDWALLVWRSCVSRTPVKVRSSTRSDWWWAGFRSNIDRVLVGTDFLSVSSKGRIWNRCEWQAGICVGCFCRVGCNYNCVQGV